MQRTVQIGSVEVGMLCSAASPIIYRGIFHKDFMRKVYEIDKSKDEADSIDLYSEMGFVMAMQAAKTLDELSKLTEEDYIKWLDQFTPFEMVMACTEIAKLYNEQEKNLSVPKKEEG